MRSEGVGQWREGQVGRSTGVGAPVHVQKVAVTRGGVGMWQRVRDNDSSPGKGRKMRRTGLAMVALAVGVALSACGSTSGSTSSSSAQSNKPLQTVTFVTDYLPNGKYVPLQWGITQGYYKDAGIQLQLQYGRGSITTAQEVAAGKEDIGDMFAPDLALVVGQNEPLEGVGQFFARSTFGFYVADSSGITNVKQLAGKEYIVTPGAIQSTLGLPTLRLAGVDTSHIQVVPVTPTVTDSTYAHTPGSFIAEGVHFAPTFQSITPSRVFPWSSLGFKAPGYTFITSKSYLASHKALVRAFLSATYRAIVSAKAHEAAAVQAYVNANPTQTSSLVKQEFALGLSYTCTSAMVQGGKPIGYQDPAQWQQMIPFLQKYAQLPSSVTANQLFTDQFFSSSNPASTTKCTAPWS